MIRTEKEEEGFFTSPVELEGCKSEKGVDP
jgi:hypothetical protein